MATTTAWEACARIERLEEELARRLNAGGGSASTEGRAAQVRRPEEVLARIA
jgi:hypothetical protein